MIASATINRIVDIARIHQKPILRIGNHAARRYLVLFKGRKAQLGIDAAIGRAEERFNIVMHIVPYIVEIVRDTAVNIGQQIVQRIMTRLSIDIACQNGVLILKEPVVHRILNE